MQTAEEVMAESRRLNEEFARENGQEDVEPTEEAVLSAIRTAKGVHILIHGPESCFSIEISKAQARRNLREVIKAGCRFRVYARSGFLWIYPNP